MNENQLEGERMALIAAVSSLLAHSQIDLDQFTARTMGFIKSIKKPPIQQDPLRAAALEEVAGHARSQLALLVAMAESLRSSG